MTRSRRRVLVVAVTALASSSCTAASQHDAKDLLVTNWSSSDISAFHLRADGSLDGKPRLTRVAKKTANPQGSIRSRDNRRLYVADWGSGTVTSYKISSKGQLKDPVTVTASRAVHPSSLALSPDGRNLYVADDGNGKRGSVAHLKLDDDGRPEPVSAVDSGGDGTTSVTVTPDGGTLLASNPGTGTISSFALSDDGSPTFVTTTASGRGTFSRLSAATDNWLWQPTPAKTR
ncbi:beta-propeller fold lactonase family protein [Kribbella sp. NPDC051718]|uniref:lactonase family protein n=1 Tax=Kribbella sp. NPDC051718 TaxID=3155168 RepID=UPI003444B620